MPGTTQVEQRHAYVDFIPAEESSTQSVKKLSLKQAVQKIADLFTSEALDQIPLHRNPAILVYEFNIKGTWYMFPISKSLVDRVKREEIEGKFVKFESSNPFSSMFSTANERHYIGRFVCLPTRAL